MHGSISTHLTPNGSFSRKPLLKFPVVQTRRMPQYQARHKVSGTSGVGLETSSSANPLPQGKQPPAGHVLGLGDGLLAAWRAYSNTFKEHLKGSELISVPVTRSDALLVFFSHPTTVIIVFGLAALGLFRCRLGFYGLADVSGAMKEHSCYTQEQKIGL